MTQCPQGSLGKSISSILLPGVFLASLLLVFIGSSAAQCPESNSGGRDGSASIDIPAGVIDVRIAAEVGAFYVANAIDAFEITGLAPDNEVSCTIQLMLQGTVSRTLDPIGHWVGGFVRAAIRYENDGRSDYTEESLANHSNVEILNLAQVVELPAAITTGVPWVVRFTLELWCDTPLDESSLRGTFRFTDLPAGAGVRSCNGFLQNPVPVQGQTWTHIKQLYRR